MKFFQVQFAYISSARETWMKITKILRSLGSELKSESFNSVKYSLCYEFSKVETLFWLTPYTAMKTRQPKDS